MTADEWKALLVRYMAHIINCEGISYVDCYGWSKDCDLSEADKTTLGSLDPEARALFLRRGQA